MGKVQEFLTKWGFTMFISLVGVAILFAIGCCIYTAIVNSFVGIIGLLGSIASLGMTVWLIYKKIKNDTTNNRD
jgi:hypothetical protein